MNTEPGLPPDTDLTAFGYINSRVQLFLVFGGATPAFTGPVLVYFRLALQMGFCMTSVTLANW